MPDENLKVVLSAEDIAARVAELGRRISDAYRGEPLVAICVLKGAFLFFADLVRQIDCGLTVDFVRLASYGAGTCRSGNMFFSKDLEVDLKGRHVLIVEDIVDTGHSMLFLKERLAEKKPLSLKICALIDKQERREVEVEVDFAGFSVAKGFLVGYGLDHAEKYRELGAVYELLVS